MKLIITFFFLSSPLLLQGKENNEDFLSSFISGSYQLIGKAPDSDETYFGKIKLKVLENGNIEVTRTISGQIVSGEARIESTLSGESKVLRIHFSANKKDFEETCLIQSDLDNYARISCYLYQPGVKTDKPGLEAFFIEQ